MKSLFSVLSYIELSFIYYLMIIYICLIYILPMHLNVWKGEFQCKVIKQHNYMELQNWFEWAFSWGKSATSLTQSSTGLRGIQLSKLLESIISEGSENNSEVEVDGDLYVFHLYGMGWLYGLPKKHKTNVNCQVICKKGLNI
jgi:hypothetical protein